MHVNELTMGSQSLSNILVPDNVEDELIGTVTFNERFTARYGPAHPLFFQGTLEQALKEACIRPAKDVSTVEQIYSVSFQID